MMKTSHLISLQFALILGLIFIVLWSHYSIAEPQVATLRGDMNLDQEGHSPRMAPQENEDLKRHRDYPMLAPTIPHKIEGYKIDLNSNKCMSCHARRNVEDSQAPMVSVTHFMDRDGQFLADVSPRRYFCNQCHVPQLEVAPLVGNEFKDVETVIKTMKDAAK